MNLIILDIVSNNYEQLENYKNLFDDSDILSLTPSSCYYLESKNITFKNFHDLISTELFRNKALDMYKDIARKNSYNKYFEGFFRDISQYICHILFIEQIISYIKINNFKNIIYITDKNLTEKFEILNNNESTLNNFIKFNKIIKIERNAFTNKINFFDKIKKYSFSQLFNKIFKNYLKYDWMCLGIKVKKFRVNIDDNVINFDISHQYIKHINYEKKLSFIIKASTSMVPNLLTFLEKDTFHKVVNLDKQNLFFFQHGSYLYKNLFLKYGEIKFADINFVFNDFTKKLFEDLGATKVYSVGSMLFNKPIEEKEKENYFLYITQGHDYTGNLQYVDFSNSLHSFDGYALYQRHKDIIYLFGTKFKDIKIIFKVHPAIVSIGVYVPFWELAEPYPNITIDVSTPIHSLIEKSKYIISDYFSTEFINRELHYKRDIVLFKGAPTPLPKETVIDMKKMFILVDTVEDLRGIVENIEEITKGRLRYDEIIEYYSSKKCNTKETVNKVLAKELHARA